MRLPSPRLLKITALTCILAACDTDSPVGPLDAATKHGVPRHPLRTYSDPSTEPCGNETLMAPSSALARPLRNRFLDPTSSAQWIPTEECVTEHYTIETEQESVHETPNFATGTEPLYAGESLSFPSSGTFVGECPPAWPRLRFREYVPSTGEEATFVIPGPISKIGNLGYTTFGFAMARYRIPEMIYNSNDGRYSIYGGTIGVTCWISIRRVTGNVLNIEIAVGRTWGYDSPGGVRFNRTPLAGGGSEGGWGWDDDNGQNGDGGSWQAAVDTYLGGGGCTPGWEIWVDGDQKCDANGYAM
jgi:hypothetical protein